MAQMDVKLLFCKRERNETIFFVSESKQTFIHWKKIPWFVSVKVKDFSFDSALQFLVLLKKKKRKLIF